MLSDENKGKNSKEPKAYYDILIIRLIDHRINPTNFNIST